MLKNFKEYPIEAKKNLLGAVLCYSALGSLSIWTNVNIYYFSYFYSLDKDLSLKLFNTMISITATSGLIIAVFSLSAAEKIGITFYIY